MGRALVYAQAPIQSAHPPLFSSSMTKSHYAVLALLTCLASGFAASAFSAEISDCQSIADRDERYACYDRAEASAPVSPAASSSSPDRTASGLPILRGIFNRGDKEEEQPAQANAPVTEPSEVDSFGLPQPKGNATVVEGEDGRKELVAAIATLEQRGYNMWLITLENGQQWAQVENKRYRLEEGESVRIYPTGWGDDYRLAAERLSSYIQVRRIK